MRQKRSIFFQMLVSYIALLTFVLSVAAVVIYGAVSDSMQKQLIQERISALTKVETIAEANERVNRAIAGAALSLGATATLEDRDGSLPVYNDPGLTAFALDWMREMCGEDEVIDSPNWGAGCTDMGDVSHLIPALHPYIKGGGGIAHGVTYYIDSREDAVLLSAKYMAGLACALLENGAEKAIAIKAGYKPSFDSCEALCRHLDRGDRQLEMVSYDGEGQAHVRW